VGSIYTPEMKYRQTTPIFRRNKKQFPGIEDVEKNQLLVYFIILAMHPVVVLNP